MSDLALNGHPTIARLESPIGDKKETSPRLPSRSTGVAEQKPFNFDGIRLRQHIDVTQRLM
jgi:hypothetical protein